MVSEQVTWLKVGSPNLRFAGAEAEERRARERHRPVRTAVPGGAVSRETAPIYEYNDNI